MKFAFSLREVTRRVGSNVHGALNEPSPRIRAWVAASLLVACTDAPSSESGASPTADSRGFAAGPADAGGAAQDSACAIDCGPRRVSMGDAAPGTAHDDGSDAHADVIGSGSSADAGPLPSHTEAGIAAAAGDEGFGANGRPIGVATCHTPESSSHPAILHFWEVMLNGDYAARAGAIAELEEAAAAHPDAEEFALVLGLANLWRLQEPQGLADLLLAPASASAGQTQLQRAYTLCPTDHRIPGWLGPVKIITGTFLDDPALIEEGAAVLKQGIEDYPTFVLFSNVIAYGDLPQDDPTFVKAVEPLRDYFDADKSPCAVALRDPSCIDTPHAAHNLEGSDLFIGDLFAKLRDRAAALSHYEDAKTRPGWASWSFQDVIEERIRSLDARVAAAASPSASDDFENAWSSQVQCSLCHRR